MACAIGLAEIGYELWKDEKLKGADMRSLRYLGMLWEECEENWDILQKE